MLLDQCALISSVGKLKSKEMLYADCFQRLTYSLLKCASKDSSLMFREACSCVTKSIKHVFNISKTKSQTGH